MPYEILYVRSKSEIQNIAQEAQFWQRLDRGTLQTLYIKRDTATNSRYRGGESQYINYYDTTKTPKRFVASEHRIVMPDGSIPHRHFKVLIDGNIKYILNES